MGSPKKSRCHYLQRLADMVGQISFALALGLVLLGGAAGGSVAADVTYPATGGFGSAATYLADAYFDHKPRIIHSPDNQSRIVARATEETFVLEVDGRIGSMKVDI